MPYDDDYSSDSWLEAAFEDRYDFYDYDDSDDYYDRDDYDDESGEE